MSIPDDDLVLTLNGLARFEHRGLSEEEAEAAIHAYRRGVPIHAIATRCKMSPKALHNALGAWALRYAKLE
jgi:hypothetical protein